MSKKAPRAALKHHMKKNANIRIGKNADLMAQLNLLMVLHRLAEECRVKAFEEKSATIKTHHVRAVAKRNFNTMLEWYFVANESVQKHIPTHLNVPRLGFELQQIV
ncbi:centromere protein W isoform X3 [Danio rerio]|uniref:Centromere protein W isoform X3 n=1 Tax=Danio rerio TaxID=7955 RepID=A0AC58HH54_DANRE